MKKNQPKTNKKKLVNNTGNDVLNPIVFDTKEAIEWLMTIPKIEWSDTMIEVFEKLDKKNQNEPAAVRFFLESSLKKELDEFVNWNNNIIT